MELAGSHPPTGDQLACQRPQLQGTKHVGRLVERRIAPLDRPPHLGGGVAAFVADTLDQEVDRLIRLHRPQVEAEGEDDPGAAVFSPEEHADAVLGSFGEIEIPQKHLPVERPALGPEGSSEPLAVGAVAGGHEALQVMARDQLVMHGRP